MFKKIKVLLFKNTSTRQTIAKNTAWLAVGQIGGRLLRAAVIIYAARVLGASGWGIFSYAMTLAAFLTIFVDFGINHILTREVSKTQDSELRARILGTSLLLKLALLALGVCAILFVGPAIASIEAAKALFPLVAIIVIADTLREFGFALCYALEKMEWSTALFVFTNVAIVALGFIFLLVTPTVISFTYAYAIGTLLGAVATFVALRTYLRAVFSHFSTALVKTVLFSAWPFALSGVLGMLMINTDIVIIGWLRGVTDVGLYSASYRIVQLLYTIPSIIAISTLPTFSRFALADPARMRQAVERVIAVVFAVALPAAAGGIILGESTIVGLFGTSFISATLSYQILLMTLLADFPAVVLSNAMFTYNRQKKLIVYAAIGGFANVLFDLLLIPPFSITGSALATLLAQVISNVYLWGALKRINYFTVLPRLTRILGATAVMSCGVLLLRATNIHFVTATGVGVLLYILALHVLNEPLLQEARLILKSVGLGSRGAPKETQLS